MSILEILHKLVLGPIELLFDVIFSFAMSATQGPLRSVILLSVAVNFLVLPLYRKADALQKEEQETAKRLKPRIDQIREAFSGDERFMILQTFYRQNHYKPYYVLRGSLSLLLQIPFFMAAYNFLSNLTILQGAAFPPLRIWDLAEPDRMLRLGGVTVNLLPIAMTLINIVSGMIYTKGMPLKSKIQLYGMALIFLVLLYNSPAGLVAYWTMNNLFSLVKNIYGKLRNPLRNSGIACSVLGLAAGVFIAFRFGYYEPRKAFWFVWLALLLQVPLLLYGLSVLIRKAKRTGRAEKSRIMLPGIRKHSWGIFLTCCVLLTVLTGLLIPSAVIDDSPEEFVEINAYRSPLIYVLHAFLLSAGTFMIWSVVYALLSEEKHRPAFSLVFAVLSLSAVVNYMFFGNGYGNMSSRLVYDLDIAGRVPVMQILLNAGILLALAGAVFFLWRGRTALLRAVCVLAALVTGGMALVNIVSVANRLPEIRRLAEQQQYEREKIIHLDRKGKNVVVLMLDRACGCLMPYIFEEKPELKEQFAGFVCYTNVLSYGNATHNGATGLFGGYEYTPRKIDERTDKTLAEKQNELLRLMPVLFAENGYDVAVCDPPYANYSWIPDLTIYEDHPEIRGYITDGVRRGDSRDESEEGIEDRNRLRERNLFCYSVFRSSPVLLHSLLYEGGNYNRSEKEVQDFFNNDLYRILQGLPDMSQVREEGGNTFLMMTSNLTHEPQILQEPEYVPAEEPDNEEYDRLHPSRFAADGTELPLLSYEQKSHYHVNMAAMLLVGNWLDYLREQGVYDNTRIILVSDHGIELGYSGMYSEKTGVDTARYNPILLVKDFGSETPFSFSNEFMTNADTPVLAFSGLIDHPVNPATGVPVTDEPKQNDEQEVCYVKRRFEGSEEYSFLGAKYFVLKNREVLDPENWNVIE